jgi:hypothetical protein
MAPGLPPPRRLTTAMSCWPNRPNPESENDVTYYRPLSHQTVVALNQFPTHLTADAAFDAWYVYEDALGLNGIAAVPLNQHGHPTYERDGDGVPLCPIKLRMQPTSQFDHTYGYRTQRFRCPFLFPEKKGATCKYEQFTKGKGCVKDVNWERGGQARVTLDRESPLYHAIYTQRTSCERINSQAKELGIERPKVHNGRSVKNLNTLISLIMNVRALQRAKSMNKGLLHMNELHPSPWEESISLMRASLSLLRSRPCAGGGHRWSNNPPHVEKIHRVVSTRQDSHFQAHAITAW